MKNRIFGIICGMVILLAIPATTVYGPNFKKDHDTSQAIKPPSPSEVESEPAAAKSAGNTKSETIDSKKEVGDKAGNSSKKEGACSENAEDNEDGRISDSDGSKDKKKEEVTQESTEEDEEKDIDAGEEIESKVETGYKKYESKSNKVADKDEGEEAEDGSDEDVKTDKVTKGGGGFINTKNSDDSKDENEDEQDQEQEQED